MSSTPANNFFETVSTGNLPSAPEKAQPWKAFHEPNPELLNSGSVTVEIPKSDETGGYLGRSTQTGSLGGDIKKHSFFDQASTQNLPTGPEKAQPWKAFHTPNPELLNSGSVTVEIPKSDETGGYLGRSTQTGSLGGDLKKN